ncbi:MAG: hypothetical protein IJN75_06845, partial [Clostridia bacterium]|nr:hypothetical protein [Clostridia bacterium]
YLSDFRVRHQAHDCTATPIKRVAYQHRRFQGVLHPLTRTTFEKVDETFDYMVIETFRHRKSFTEYGAAAGRKSSIKTFNPMVI